MSAELHCHLIDFVAMPSLKVSLTLGYLEAFARADPRIYGRCDFTQHCHYLKDRLEPTAQAIQRAIESHRSAIQVIAFTNYFWNLSRNLELAAHLKLLFPEVFIVFGGNEVTGQGKTILADSAVDIVVNGEGENAFADLLAALLTQSVGLKNVRGVSFRDAYGEIITTEPQARIDNLDTIPSPFICGLYAPSRMAASKTILYELSRGCPFKCSFCYWGGAIGTRTRRFSLDRIKQDLDIIISQVPQGATLYLADANFGMMDSDLEVARLLVELTARHKKRLHLFTNWAKNTSKRVVEVASLLFRNRLISSVSLSAQSLNPEVLVIAQRKNIPFRYYRELQNEFKQVGIPTYTELLLGLPGESYESFLSGIDMVMSGGGTPVIYPLLLLKNTEYNQPHVRRLHDIQSRVMPYEPSDNLASVETVVGHKQLSYADWLKGMGLRLLIPLLYLGILRCVMQQLHRVHGLPYGTMLSALVDYCMAGEIQSHALFGVTFANYIESWDSADNYDSDLIDRVIGKEAPRNEPVHFQALMKLLLQNRLETRQLVSELTRILAKGIATDGSSTALTELVEYQNVLVEALSQVSEGDPREIATPLDLNRVRAYAGCDVGYAHGGLTRLRVQPRYFRVPFEVVSARIFYGNLDTLELFESQ